MKIPRPTNKLIREKLFDGPTNCYCAVGWLCHVAGIPDSGLAGNACLEDLSIDDQYKFHTMFPHLFPRKMDDWEYSGSSCPYDSTIIEEIYVANETPNDDSARFAEVEKTLKQWSIEFEEAKA